MITEFSVVVKLFILLQHKEMLE